MALPKSKKPSRLLFLVPLMFGSASSATYALGQCDNATPVVINKTTGLMTLAPGEHKLFEIKTPGSGLLTLSTLGETDTTGQLYDKDCLPINGAKDFSSGSGTNFQISRKVDKGPYYLGVSGNLSTTQGAYKIQVDGDFATDDHGVSCSSATVARDFVEPGALLPYGDRDFFQVKVDGAGHLLVQTEGATNTTGRLYDSHCLFINGAVDYSSGQDSNFKIDKVLNPGVYFIEVSGNNAGIKGDYNLRVGGDIDFPSGACAGQAATQSGTNGNDVIHGTPGNDVIQSFGGDDVIFGLEGDDLICGGDGDDVIQGGNGRDRLFGETGHDLLQGGGKDDGLNGGAGTDVCDGGDQNDTANACEVTSRIP
ncbi:MAG: calcium-binding protein [Methylovulum miyakonense]|uniref:calcium-binding protein n=1 Tax=Methylovulum miyakonense TaxID=645578 RepID=UPI003BB77711